MKRWLTENANWLLILDGADDLGAAADFIPESETGRTILTSRSQDVHLLKDASAHALAVFEPNEGVVFLKKRAGRASVSEPDEEIAVRELASELGWLPLAIEQVGAYAANQNMSFRKCLAFVRAHRAAAWGEAISATWRMNFAVMEAKFPAAADVLRLCAFFAPTAIPVSLIENGALNVSPAVAEAIAKGATPNDIIEPLARYSLIRTDGTGATFEAHRLTQMLAKAEMDNPTRQIWAERATRALNAEFPLAIFNGWLACGRLLPHALIVTEAIDVGAESDVTEAVWLLNQTGGFLFKCGCPADAERLYAQALKIRETTFGMQHLSVATSLNNLAAVYAKQGKYAEAEPLYARGLEIREAKLSPQHPAVVESLTKLAETHQAQGRYVESGLGWSRALAILEKTSGEAHPTTLEAMENYCVTLLKLGDIGKAQELQRCLATLRTKPFGS